MDSERQGQHHLECQACRVIPKGPVQWYCKEHKIDLCDNCKSSHASKPCEVVTYKEKFQERLMENPVMSKEVKCPLSFLRDIGIAGKDQFWLLSSRSETIKLIDSNGKELKSVKASAQPMRLAVSHDQKSVFFTVPSENLVMKMDAKSGKITRLFSTGDFEPIGIGSCRSGDLLVCLYNSKDIFGKVVKYSQSGQPVMEIERDGSKRSIYTKPHYVIENKNGGICVSDYSKREVILVAANGEFQFSYDGNKARKVVENFTPEGIATDSRGNYLVADHWNNTVHIIKENGAFVSYLLFGKIEGPTGITVDDEDKLWVCEFGTDDGTVKVISYLQ